MYLQKCSFYKLSTSYNIKVESKMRMYICLNILLYIEMQELNLLYNKEAGGINYSPETLYKFFCMHPQYARV